MGGKGPKPTPTAVLAARGSWRAAARKHEPQYEICTPEMPHWLRGEHAREFFKRISAALCEAGVMTAVDKDNLASTAEALQEYLDAEEILRKEGKIILGKNGETIHPMYVIKDKAVTRFNAGCARFGLTPADRTRVQVGNADIKQAQSKSEDSGKQRFFTA